MSRKCDAIASKGVLSGNMVSHSNIKTKRKFNPNIKIFRLFSNITGKTYTLNLAVSTLRTIEKNGGLDGFLLATANNKLTNKALSIKNEILKANQSA